MISQRSAEKRHNAAVEQHAEDWRSLLSTEWGRRWFIKVIKQADPWRVGRMDLFDSGRTDFARCMLAEARAADLMATLQAEREEASRLLAAGKKVVTQPDPEEEPE